MGKRPFDRFHSLLVTQRLGYPPLFDYINGAVVEPEKRLAVFFVKKQGSTSMQDTGTRIQVEEEGNPCNARTSSRHNFSSETVGVRVGRTAGKLIILHHSS